MQECLNDKNKEVFRDYYFWRVFLHYLDSFIVLSLSNRQNEEVTLVKHID